jgi:hypothetical protein
MMNIIDGTVYARTLTVVGGEIDLDSMLPESVEGRFRIHNKWAFSRSARKRKEKRRKNKKRLRAKKKKKKKNRK